MLDNQIIVFILLNVIELGYFSTIHEILVCKIDKAQKHVYTYDYYFTKPKLKRHYR